MRLHLTALLFLALAGTAFAGNTIQLVRVWPGYRTAESFEHISEYFGKEEDAASQHILRSQPGVRPGYYFLVRLKNLGAPVLGAHFELHYVSPDATEPRTCTFDSDLAEGSHAYHLGLTGTDWPGETREDVIAWKLRVIAADGSEILQTQSFLWALP